MDNFCKNIKKDDSIIFFLVFLFFQKNALLTKNFYFFVLEIQEKNVYKKFRTIFQKYLK